MNLMLKRALLALMGIETNFGKYLGKMDIVSSLATLGYDKRRSDFFTEELLILLKLVDKEQLIRFYMDPGQEHLEIFSLCQELFVIMLLILIIIK